MRYLHGNTVMVYILIESMMKSSLKVYQGNNEIQRHL